MALYLRTSKATPAGVASERNDTRITELLQRSAHAGREAAIKELLENEMDHRSQEAKTDKRRNKDEWHQDTLN